MRRYLLLKLMSLIPVLVGVSLAAFILGVISPGNPAEIALAQNGFEPTPEQVAEVAHQMGLDAPYPVQYLRWVGRALSGDLGTSYATGRPVGAELRRHLPVTLRLALSAAALTCAFGVALGCLAAAHENRWPDGFVRGLINVQLSLPAFWLALLLILLFAETLRWLPTSGTGGLRHMLLPAFVLASASTAMAARLTRAAVLAELGKQYCTAAAARGIRRWRLVLCNALPNALPSIIALLGNSLAGMLGGSVVIESIFALPGLGSYALEAISKRDYPALQGYVLIAGCVYVTITLLVDIMSMLLNPKVRLGGRRA